MRITVQDDFDLRKIADSGQCFRVREWDDDTFRFITGRDVLYLQQTGPDALEADCPDGAWERVWARYFDLGRDYAQVRAAIPPSDAWMRHAAEQGAGIRILRQDAWETLVTFILSQRKRIPAIKSCVERLSARFGERVETARETLYAFPSAAALAAAGEPELDECGLGYRTPFVRAAAEAVASGALSLAALERLPDEALTERLKALYGVGDKVASCVALFAYGRTAAAPVDTWIRRLIDIEYRGENPFPAYGGAAGILQQYAFYRQLLGA